MISFSVQYRDPNGACKAFDDHIKSILNAAGYPSHTAEGYDHLTAKRWLTFLTKNPDRVPTGEVKSYKEK